MTAAVIPAQAGIQHAGVAPRVEMQCTSVILDSRLRGNDGAMRKLP